MGSKPTRGNEIFNISFCSAEETNPVLSSVTQHIMPSKIMGKGSVLMGKECGIQCEAKRINTYFINYLRQTSAYYVHT